MSHAERPTNSNKAEKLGIIFEIKHLSENLVKIVGFSPDKLWKSFSYGRKDKVREQCTARNMKNVAVPVNSVIAKAKLNIANEYETFLLR